MTRLSLIAMTEAEADVVRRVGTRLHKLLAASDGFVSEAVRPPVGGSPIDRAYKSDVRDAYDLAYALLFSSEDHLRTILSVLTNKDGGLPSYALYTLLRAAGDADVRCRHLLDPKIAETTRLARALNERLDNLDEQRKVMPAGKHYDDRVAHLEQRATANGIVPLRSSPKGGRPGKIVAFDEHPKSGFDLFSTYLPSGSDAFRILSAYVHSKPWVQLTRDRGQPSDEPGIQNVRTDLDVLRFSSVLDVVLDLHDENIRHWLHLGGYPDEVWREAKKGPGA